MTFGTTPETVILFLFIDNESHAWQHARDARGGFFVSISHFAKLILDMTEYSLKFIQTNR